MREKYTHGHFGKVVDNHAGRTAANSASFVLPHLKETDSLIDLGCGPGSITLDLAEWVESAVGIDAAPEAIARAEDDQERRGVGNATFLVGDIYALDFPDNTFDVVYAHQVLQHLADPVAMLREAFRVLKPGCIVAVRDADYGTMVHDPHDPLIDRWQELYYEIARHNGGEPNAGRRLRGWVAAAGYIDVTPTTSTWTYSTEAAVARWCELWTSRLRQARMGRDLIRQGMATAEEVDEIAQAFERWAHADEPFFAFLHGEVLARKPPG